MKNLLILDYGHGSPSLVEKEFKHASGIVYEADLNRTLGNYIKAKCCNISNLDIYETCPYNEDWSLKYRTDLANYQAQSYESSILISVHHNASPEHNASGLESFIHTNPSNESYILQGLFEQHVKDLLPNEKFRGSKQKNLHMLRESNMPALMGETFFFDYYPDLLKIKDPEIRDKCAEIYYRTVNDYFNLKKLLT